MSKKTCHIPENAFSIVKMRKKRMFVRLTHRLVSMMNMLGSPTWYNACICQVILQDNAKLSEAVHAEGVQLALLVGVWCPGFTTVQEDTQKMRLIDLHFGVQSARCCPRRSPWPLYAGRRLKVAALSPWSACQVNLVQFWCQA